MRSHNPVRLVSLEEDEETRFCLHKKMKRPDFVFSLCIQRKDHIRTKQECAVSPKIGWYLDLGLLASKAMRKYIPVV